jgi:hypothetical protein
VDTTVLPVAAEAVVVLPTVVVVAEEADVDAAVLTPVLVSVGAVDAPPQEASTNAPTASAKTSAARNVMRERRTPLFGAVLLVAGLTITSMLDRCTPGRIPERGTGLEYPFARRNEPAEVGPGWKRPSGLASITHPVVLVPAPLGDLHGDQHDVHHGFFGMKYLSVRPWTSIEKITTT